MKEEKQGSQHEYLAKLNTLSLIWYLIETFNVLILLNIRIKKTVFISMQFYIRILIIGRE